MPENLSLDKRLINKYKNYRKQKYLNFQQGFKFKYAFVGVGNHSINNLYPCLDYLNVPIKYVCTRTPDNAAKMARRYPGAIGTDDIDKVVKDPEVAGVLISAEPSSHFDLANKVISSRKSVFVEKPPCMSLSELRELKQIAEKSQVVCTVGLQRRYSTVYSMLEKRLKRPNSYSMRFVTGGYPEGDEILDLFIHPLDIVIYLFGKTENVVVKSTTRTGSLTLFLILEHENGVVGSMELSTNYVWNRARESLIVNAERGIFEANDLNKLTYNAKSLNVLGIPLEKIISSKQTEEVLFDNSTFIPIAKHNQIFTHGFFKEIETFVDDVENDKKGSLSTPGMVMPTYELIENITGILDGKG